MKSIVVAYDNDRTIGRSGELPWAGAMPADMRHFKDLTEDTSVIMGRATFESLPDHARPLPNRQNIVMTLSGRAMGHVLLATSLGDAFSQADHEVMVIGGAQVYEQALPFVDRVYATEIDTSVDNGDAFFPPLNPDDWYIDSKETYEKDDVNAFDYSFVTYIRRNLSASDNRENT